jgi:predicted GNAT family N-acyltransferase
MLMVRRLSEYGVMTVELGVVFGGPNDRLWLPRLREWITSNASFFGRLGVRPVVKPLGSPKEALGWRAELPNERVVVAFGFSRYDFERGKIDASCDPIIVPDNATTGANALFSPEAIGVGIAATRPDITEQLRKSLIRVALFQRRIEVRAPKNDAELGGYFSLRYRVWSEVGYLRDENKNSQVEWEVDFWDRTAVPLCAITPDGKTIGCVRLISNLGDEESAYVDWIQRLLDQAGDRQLRDLFRFQHAPMHPFDVLFEFPGFRAKFRDLLRSRAVVAEIGRVAVDPKHRGQCLSEVLVDSAVSLAKSRGVECLLLACHEKLRPLYAKCGFQPVQGLRSEKFFNIQVPSIVMERRI